MALPTSGALSLDAIHVEAGGSTGTTCSLNDTDIRGLTPGSGKTINSTQGTTVDFDDFYGASSGFNMTLTVGSSITSTTGQYSTTTTVLRGFTSTLGSLSPTSNSSFLGGATISAIRNFGTSDNLSGSSTPTLLLQVTTGSVANSNSSFTTLDIGGSSLSRSNATYSTSTGFSSWTWTGSPVATTTVTNAAANFAPFTANGTTQTVSIS